MNYSRFIFSSFLIFLFATVLNANPQRTGKPLISNEAGKHAVNQFRENEKSLAEKEKKAIERIEKSAKTEHLKIRNELVKELEDLLSSETKAGNLDEAIELRKAIKYYQRYRRKSSKASIAALTKEVKRLETKLAETTLPTEVTIPENAVPWKGHSYLRVDELQCRNVAQEIAEASGGHLVRIEDKREHAFVHSLIKSTGREWYLIDGNDEQTEGTWLWSNREQISYLDWDKDEPTGKNTRSKSSFSHALFMHSRSGKMHDGSGGQRAGFVIEWDAIKQGKQAQSETE